MKCDAHGEHCKAVKKCDAHGKHCRTVGRDRNRSNRPLYDCPTNTWQVGIAGAQPANYLDSEVTKAFQKVYGSINAAIREGDAIRWTATLAGYEENSDEFEGIANSKDRVRRSWLLRDPLIGFSLLGPYIHQECVVKPAPKKGVDWCTFGSYDAAKNYSHTRAGVIRAIEDLKKIFRSELAR
jgi:hypothetical protein